MTLQAINSAFMYPPWQGWGHSPTQGDSLTAAAHKMACVFRVPKTGTLDKFEFRMDTVTQAPTNGIRCSFQDVDGSGDPDGTQDEYRDITSGITSDTWMVPGLMTSDGTDGGTKRSVTRNDLLCAVVEFVSFNASDEIKISKVNGSAGHMPVSDMPYKDLFTASWAKAEDLIPLALKYSDGSYETLGPGLVPWAQINTQSKNSGSTPDELGNIITLPFKCTVVGLWAYFDADNAADLVLYDTDGSTVLGTTSVSATARRGTDEGGILAYFTADVTLNANEAYRAVIKPTTVSNVVIDDFEFDSVDIMDAIPGGQNIHMTERTDAGSWTETTTKRVWIGLMISKLGDEAAGGGGGTIIVGG